MAARLAALLGIRFSDDTLQVYTRVGVNRARGRFKAV